MNENPRYVTFRDYLRVVRERRLLVAFVTLLFAGAAAVYSIQQDPLYAAEASLEFRDINVETSIVGTTSYTGETPEQRAAIGSESVIRLEVADRARKILKSPLSSSALLGSVSARPETLTHLVVVEGRAGDAEGAARLTNAFARATRVVERERVRDRFADAARVQRGVLKEVGRERADDFSESFIRQQISRLEQLSRIIEPVVIRAPASAPARPFQPKPIRTSLLGLLLGLMVGLVAAFVRDSLDRRFRSSHEVTEELHLPLLGYVREDVLGRSLSSNGQRALSDVELEGFRILRTNIEFLDIDDPPKVTLVTSSLPEEGKSTISTGLAAACASAGKRTLLVECDMRRPTLAERTHLRDMPGLADYLVGRAAPGDILQTVTLPTLANSNGHGPVPSPQQIRLVCITAGAATPQPAELLRSQRCRLFFEQVRETYDAVIVDTCPLLSVADTLELLPIADAVVVCVRASQTTRDQVRAAKAALSHFPDRPTGVVMTGIRARDETGYYGYYSYNYVYGGERR